MRRRYAELAETAAQGGSCCSPEEQTVFGTSLYGSEDLGAVPEAAADASLGCGNPTAIAELSPGEVVLDLGSGGGIDVILSARRVGPDGHAYGLDMTDEMLDLARANAAKAGVTNVEFLKGHIERDPAARRVGRCRDLQLCDQSVHGQGLGHRREPPGSCDRAAASR